MNQSARINMARMLARECFLWIKTEWRFHFCVGVGAVLLSLGWALCSHSPTAFTRSGALMTVAGVFMTYRGYFRRIDDLYSRDTGQADRRAFSRWHPMKSREEAKAEDRKAFRYGLISIIIGTLIWAYGDCAFPNRPNQTMQRTASNAVICALSVCHPTPWSRVTLARARGR
ncbi:MAG: hypothetical protein V7609_1527 [Verrucomicrobiota bacterium]